MADDGPRLQAVDETKTPGGTDSVEPGGTDSVEPGGTDSVEPGGTDSVETDAVTGAPTEGRDRLRRGIFLIPNLITTGALFSAFYAIVAAMNGRFIAAGLAVYAAALLDTLDGRVARWTRSESPFGAQYDSLSDMVAFGVAPALVVFEWGLSTLGQIGWVVTFIYMACAALRLARFNTSGDNHSFTGLPSPAAASVIASAVWLWSDSIGGEPSVMAAAVMGTLTAVTGLSMVSNFEYFSPKMFGLKGRVPFIGLVAVVLAFSIVLLDPPFVLLVLSIGYAFSGPVMEGWRRFGPGASA